jgi:alpha-L-rhamnosidase
LQANPVDVYVAKGGAAQEVYEPTMTYHGFRYVEMSIADGPSADSSPAKLPTPPTLDSIVGVNLRSSVAEAAVLKFGPDPTNQSNLVQKLSNNSWWTEAGNSSRLLVHRLMTHRSHLVHLLMTHRSYWFIV